MTPEEFQELLLRYQRNEATAEEQQRIHAWYDRLAADSQEELPAAERPPLQAKLWSTIRERIDEPEPEIQIRPLRKAGWYVGVAASILLVLSIGLWFWTQSSVNSGQLAFHTAAPLITARGPQTLTLSDQSQVTLLEGSSLRYSSTFTGKLREVDLQGTAFFQITKNPEKPFLVHTGSLETKVLGTSFWVRHQPKQSYVQVQVVTGKVSVQQDQNQVILVPNQLVTYSREKPWLQTGLVQNPLVVDASVSMRFKDVPLLRVVERLEKRYGISLLIKQSALRQCPFTGDLTGLGLYEQLGMICQALNATYQSDGTQILLQGAGCR